MAFQKYKTKTQKKRAIEAIQQKAKNLWLVDVFSIQDCSAIEKICKKNLKKL